MAVQLQSHNKYRLGEFELDPDRYLLKHGDQQLHLPELPFQLLLYLVEHRERYVNRQELLERFWAGSGVYEETLTKCISTIRTQLNDPPTEARYIETRKKVGYRYIGPCQESFGSEPEERGLETEIFRGVAVLVEEEDDQPEIVRTAVPQHISVQRRFLWANPVLRACAALVVVAGIVAYSRWPPDATTEAVEPIRSIAVLPLKNLTGDPTNDYFSDGLTEGLITSLSKIESLSVQSRSSVFRFQNRDVDPREVGKQLGVAAVLEGNVRALGDVFTLQDDISHNVAEGLKLRLTSDAERQIAKRYTDNIEAYRLYLQGRFFLMRFLNNEDLAQAVKAFEA